MRIVIDTCVWVAALRSRRGAGFAVLAQIPHKKLRFGVSVALYLEYKAKLTEIAEKGLTPLSKAICAAANSRPAALQVVSSSAPKAQYTAMICGSANASSRKQVDSVLSALAFYCTEVPMFFRLRPNLRDEKDNMVFECAANLGASAIVTHNVRDFITSEAAGYGLEIMTPARFIHNLGGSV